MVTISVIIPTYNPTKYILENTLMHLRKQSIPNQSYEIIIVDNNSSNQLLSGLQLYDNERIVHEPKQGLTYARLKGFEVAKSQYMLLCDDDNFLHNDYLYQAIHFLDHHHEAGALGGKSLPIFETKPEDWLLPFKNKLALRDLGDDVLISNTSVNEYPPFAPMGAGMVLRKSAIVHYIKKIQSSHHQITDRTGASLISGGDNDMVFEILKAGYKVAYVPQLTLEHYINKQRLTYDYMQRLCYGIEKSWVQVLHQHQVLPWQPVHPNTALLRKLKAYITTKAYISKGNYLKYMEICGRIDGLSSVY
ncbi:MAG: glycosyltransferase [Cytophagales bacterium]|nr:glycosyltransferase [Cytophagales bacterium]